jgi:hypothetical protein
MVMVKHTTTKPLLLQEQEPTAEQAHVAHSWQGPPTQRQGALQQEAARKPVGQEHLAGCVLHQSKSDHSFQRMVTPVAQLSAMHRMCVCGS